MKCKYVLLVVFCRCQNGVPIQLSRDTVLYIDTLIHNIMSGLFRSDGSIGRLVEWVGYVTTVVRLVRPTFSPLIVDLWNYSMCTRPPPPPSPPSIRDTFKSLNHEVISKNLQDRTQYCNGGFIFFLTT